MSFTEDDVMVLITGYAGFTDVIVGLQARDMLNLHEGISWGLLSGYAGFTDSQVYCQDMYK